MLETSEMLNAPPNTRYSYNPLQLATESLSKSKQGNHPLRWDRTDLVIEVKQFDQCAVKVDGSGRVTLRKLKFLRKFDKIAVDRIPGTTRTIQFLKTTNNAENLSPTNQRTNRSKTRHSKAGNFATGNKASSFD